MSDEGVIEIFPETTAERFALQGWDALHPVKSVSEGFLEPLPMRPARAIRIATSKDDR